MAVPVVTAIVKMPPAAMNVRVWFVPLMSTCRPHLAAGHVTVRPAVSVPAKLIVPFSHSRLVNVRFASGIAIGDSPFSSCGCEMILVSTADVDVNTGTAGVVPYEGEWSTMVPAGAAPGT